MNQIYNNEQKYIRVSLDAPTGWYQARCVPALTYLTSYNKAPSHSHYKAAIHALKYLFSISSYGISFHSDALNTLQG
jgi:hypothetical protein